MWKCPCLGEGAAAWEQKERSAFGENAVERPLVPLQNRGVSREERFSTEVTTDGSWERSVTDCVSVALTKEGANGAQGAALVGGDSPAVEAEWSCAPVSTAREREKHLTPSVRCLSDGTRVGRKVDKTQRRLARWASVLESTQTYSHWTLACRRQKYLDLLFTQTSAGAELEVLDLSAKYHHGSGLTLPPALTGVRVYCWCCVGSSAPPRWRVLEQNFEMQDLDLSGSSPLGSVSLHRFTTVVNTGIAVPSLPLSPLGCRLLRESHTDLS